MQLMNQNFLIPFFFFLDSGDSLNTKKIFHLIRQLTSNKCDNIKIHKTIVTYRAETFNIALHDHLKCDDRKKSKI